MTRRRHRPQRDWSSSSAGARCAWPSPALACPAPDGRRAETLVRPDLVGLCGTDLEIIGGQVDPAYIRYPIVLGHEWTGIVAGDSPLAGSSGRGRGRRGLRSLRALRSRRDEPVRDLRRVRLHQRRRRRGPGRRPAALVHPIAAGVAAEDAVLTEPASVVYRGLTRAGPRPGSRVLVIGDGTIALLAVYLLRLWSPAEVVLLGRRDGAGRPRRRGRRGPLRDLAGRRGRWLRPRDRGGRRGRRPPPSRSRPPAAAAPSCCSACRRTARRPR